MALGGRVGEAAHKATQESNRGEEYRSLEAGKTARRYLWLSSMSAEMSYMKRAAAVALPAIPLFVRTNKWPLRPESARHTVRQQRQCRRDDEPASRTYADTRYFPPSATEAEHYEPIVTDTVYRLQDGHGLPFPPFQTSRPSTFQLFVNAFDQHAVRAMTRRATCGSSQPGSSGNRCLSPGAA